MVLYSVGQWFSTCGTREVFPGGTQPVARAKSIQMARKQLPGYMQSLVSVKFMDYCNCSSLATSLFAMLNRSTINSCPRLLKLNSCCSE